MNTRDVDRILDEETEASEAARDQDATYVRSRHRSKEPSQVYSVRLPVERLEELRVLAERSHVTPSALMRRLVIEGLDRQADASSRLADTRKELGPESEKMIVMTQEQAIDFVAQIVRNLLDDLGPAIGQARAGKGDASSAA
jgi:predicted DNA-binding protein